MADAATLQDLDDRIAILRTNIREVTEQATGSSGAADESRSADRIATFEEELAKLLKEREALGG
jgi:hypothetical protein